MSKEVQMTFRVEPQLRADFSYAALLEDRPAAQVLRELMRAYVSRSREQGNSPASNPANSEVQNLASEADTHRREQAVNFARASVGLEGFYVTEAEEAHARRLVAGDITLAEYLQAKPHV